MLWSGTSKVSTGFVCFPDSTFPEITFYLNVSAASSYLDVLVTYGQTSVIQRHKHIIYNKFHEQGYPITILDSGMKKLSTGFTLLGMPKKNAIYCLLFYRRFNIGSKLLYFRTSTYKLYPSMSTCLKVPLLHAYKCNKKNKGLDCLGRPEGEIYNWSMKILL